MDAAGQAREQKKQELLQELAELMVEEQVEEGVFLNTPHYSIIERMAVTLGRQLSREAQQRATREVAANSPAKCPCPTCGTHCDVHTDQRQVRSVDGPVELTESVAYCHECRRAFFPSAIGHGTG
jgi:hypothetical protein